MPQKALGSHACLCANHLCWLSWHWPTRLRGSLGRSWPTEEYTELQYVLLKRHERCEAVEDVSRSNGGMGKRSLRRDWENQVSRTAPIERAKSYWTRSSHLHTGPRRVKSRTLRPDTRQHLTTCSPKERLCLHLPGRPHTSGAVIAKKNCGQCKAAPDAYA